jgi:Lysozyme inhibitor LprI
MSPIRILAFAAIFAGSLVSVPALAGPNPDAQKIDACLKAAIEKDQSGVACIGIVADPCIAVAKTTNSYREDTKTCAARELAIWTARMQTAIREFQKGADKQMVTSVTNAQQSWSASLTRLCPVFDKVDPDVALGGANYCRLQETAMRVIGLERLAVAVNPH